jgi:streptogramin lyase
MKAEYIKMESHPHTLSIDADGKIWGNGSHVFRFDSNTRAIQYWPSMKTAAHPGAFINRLKIEGSEPSMVSAGAYHAVRDSKGIVWYTSLYTGGIVRLDPATGQQEYINPERIASSRGLDIDADDNIWFSDWFGYRLAKYEPVSGKTKFYKLPTEFGMPYSVFVDKTRGYIWTSDYNGNNLTRLDPRTEKFVEYPMPNKDSFPRFISIDKNGWIWFAEWWNSRLGVLDPGYAESRQ